MRLRISNSIVVPQGFNWRLIVAKEIGSISGGAAPTLAAILEIATNDLSMIATTKSRNLRILVDKYFIHPAGSLDDPDVMTQDRLIKIKIPDFGSHSYFGTDGTDSSGGEVGFWIFAGPPTKGRFQIFYRMRFTDS